MEEKRFNYSTNDATRFVDELKDRVHELYDENKRLKERIDEAIEYIEKNIVDYITNYDDLREKLLEILDKEKV